MKFEDRLPYLLVEFFTSKDYNRKMELYQHFIKRNVFQKQITQKN